MHTRPELCPTKKAISSEIVPSLRIYTSRTRSTWQAQLTWVLSFYCLRLSTTPSDTPHTRWSLDRWLSFRRLHIALWGMLLVWVFVELVVLPVRLCVCLCAGVDLISSEQNKPREGAHFTREWSWNEFEIEVRKKKALERDNGEMKRASGIQHISLRMLREGRSVLSFPVWRFDHGLNVIDTKK